MPENAGTMLPARCYCAFLDGSGIAEPEAPECGIGTSGRPAAQAQDAATALSLNSGRQQASLRNRLTAPSLLEKQLWPR